MLIKVDVLIYMLCNYIHYCFRMNTMCRNTGCMMYDSTKTTTHFSDLMRIVRIVIKLEKNVVDGL